MKRVHEFGVALLAVVVGWCAGCAPASQSDLPPMPSTMPTDTWFQAEVVQSETPVLVEFGATWCPPCRKLEPLLERLADEYDGRVKVVKVDVDERRDLSSHFSVSGIPMLLVIDSSEVVDGAVGYIEYEELESLVKPYIRNAGS